MVMSTGSRVVVQVPATSANLGPGFDALGLALDIREELHLWVLAEGGSPEIRVSGVNAGIFPEDETLLAYRSAVAVFERIGMQAPPLGLELVTRIPSSGGLGGSAAAIVAGVVAANALAGKPLDRAGELALVAEIEGHPDNVSAALLGGLVVCVAGRDGLVTSRLPVGSDLRAVVCLPDEAISTKSARGSSRESFRSAMRCSISGGPRCLWQRLRTRIGASCAMRWMTASTNRHVAGSFRHCIRPSRRR